MHTIISGQSFSGKSFLAKALCAQLHKSRNCLVLDPFLDKWQADYVTSNADDFLRIAKSNKSCALFVDESGAAIGRGVDARPLHWLATGSRHWGHRCYFITQQIRQLEPIIRGQCSEWFCFSGTNFDAKTLYAETGDEIFFKIPKLPRYHFIHKAPFIPAKIQVLKI